MPIAEITRTETAERSRLLQVDDYDVALDLTRGGEVFGSVSVIRFRCAEPGASSYVDLIAKDVHEIVLNGVPLDALVVELGSNRNAIYKTLFDARRKLRAALVTHGYLDDDVARQP